MTISVITVVLNNKTGLQRTFESVFAQKYPAIEYIVIDGQSSDGSVNLINQWKEKIAISISEPDKGIYDAMNKGIRKASGDYIIFLNSGDYFYNEHALENLLTQSSHEDIIYGDLLFKSDSEEELHSYPDVVDLKFFAFNSLPHPSTLIRRKLFEQYGLYNEEIKICADWAFFLDAIAKHHASYKHVPLPSSIFMRGGVSSGGVKIEEEKRAYISDNYLFYFESYLSLRRIQEQAQLINNSRFLKLLLRILPNKYINLFVGDKRATAK